MGRFGFIGGLVVVLSVIMSGCSLSASPGPQEIEGRWDLVAFSSEGTEVPVEVGTNADAQPWIHFGARTHGSTGCNEFTATSTPPYVVDDEMMSFSEVSTQAQYCPMSEDVEKALYSFVYSDGFLFTTGTDQDDAEVMRWELAGRWLVFERP
ncbi:MAG: META domain-containing protein [Acidimicrobiia bacterium]|nr:META domain-containing protein [Acidimicrobiia bacterium]